MREKIMVVLFTVSFVFSHIADSMRTPELENKELYEVELPIKLPKIKLNLVHLKGELTKVDKKFIKEYLKKQN